MANINLKIEKKDLWLFLAIVMFLVGAGFVMAYNDDWKTAPVDPSIHGHTSDEIAISTMTQAEEDAASAAGNLRTGQMWLISP